MLLNYTYEKANKVFTLWLSKALLCPKRKGAMQQLWLRMEARQIAPAFNPLSKFFVNALCPHIAFSITSSSFPPAEIICRDLYLVILSI